MQTYEFEITDTFGGEANYCWVRKHTITANNLRGAIWKLSRLTGYSFRYVGCERWDVRGACICCFLLDA